MRSFRSFLGAGKKALAIRLDRLQQTLDLLKDKLRATVAQALGETVGGTVHETLMSTLSDAEAYSDSYSRPYSTRRSSSNYWEDPDEPPWGGNSYGRDYQDDYYPKRYQEPEPEAPKSKSSRLAVAISAGLRTAAWWVRRWWGKGAMLFATLVGVFTAGAAYLGGELVDTGLSLAESVEHIAALNETALRGVSGLSSSPYK